MPKTTVNLPDVAPPRRKRSQRKKGPPTLKNAVPDSPALNILRPSPIPPAPPSLASESTSSSENTVKTDTKTQPPERPQSSFSNHSVAEGIQIDTHGSYTAEFAGTASRSSGVHLTFHISLDPDRLCTLLSQSLPSLKSTGPCNVEPLPQPKKPSIDIVSPLPLPVQPQIYTSTNLYTTSEYQHTHYTCSLPTHAASPLPRADSPLSFTEIRPTSPSPPRSPSPPCVEALRPPARGLSPYVNSPESDSDSSYMPPTPPADDYSEPYVRSDVPQALAWGDQGFSFNQILDSGPYVESHAEPTFPSSFPKSFSSTSPFVKEAEEPWERDSESLREPESPAMYNPYRESTRRIQDLNFGPREPSGLFSKGFQYTRDEQSHVRFMHGAFTSPLHRAFGSRDAGFGVDEEAEHPDSDDSRTDSPGDRRASCDDDDDEDCSSRCSSSTGGTPHVEASTPKVQPETFEEIVGSKNLDQSGHMIERPSNLVPEDARTSRTPTDSNAAASVSRAPVIETANKPNSMPGQKSVPVLNKLLTNIPDLPSNSTTTSPVLSTHSHDTSLISLVSPDSPVLPRPKMIKPLVHTGLHNAPAPHTHPDVPSQAVIPITVPPALNAYPIFTPPSSSAPESVASSEPIVTTGLGGSSIGGGSGGRGGDVDCNNIREATIEAHQSTMMQSSMSYQENKGFQASYNESQRKVITIIVN
ncbi:hypothetical protein SISNIDRAFT_542638 [Sistotremastrum niveocremeum HHB9708]|uniref:Uncharacterized protein n=1 Tax=Sistotremastrum niveocremeum HHB9708 TaxID=1314777 RepID=A0A164X5X0_9AGAM|nr:hypothetical protein SISNIDRAFT_542638 [Sistotremastrum niveocremeum HHB9708]